MNELQRQIFQQALEQELDSIKKFLLEKNAAYGNSALDPIRCFSKASTEEQIRVRIDDKLSRLARGSEAGEDTVKDLLGYLIILRIHQRTFETLKGQDHG